MKKKIEATRGQQCQGPALGNKEMPAWQRLRFLAAPRESRVIFLGGGVSSCPKRGIRCPPCTWLVGVNPACPPTSSFPSRCPFGFGGAACQEPLLLALVGVSCFAGLLLWLLLALLLFRRAPPAQETLVALPLPLRSRVLSLPRVQPPGSMPELEDCPPFVLDPEREGLPAEGAPRMKTFLGSRGPPPSAPQTVRGCSNLVFIGDAGELAEQDHF